MTSQINTKTQTTKIESANKKICDGFGCLKSAKEVIEINCGEYGTISLVLCSTCLQHFDEVKQDV